MRMLVKMFVVLLCTGTLAACVSEPGTIGLLIDPPTESQVQVTVTNINPDGTCEIITPTVEPTCSKSDGPADLPDFVCQSPSPPPGSSQPIRRIQWKSSSGDPFTLEFPDGHPFVNVQAHDCRISTPASEFKCNVRQNNLVAVYKYNVVFSPNCKKDPYVILTR